MLLPSWIFSASRSRHKSPRPRARLLLEVLEGRLAPAVHTWTGAGGNGLWSNASNWDTVPTVAEATTSNVILNFPAVAHESTTDDIPGLIVDQLSLQATGYSIKVAQTLTLRQGDNPTNLVEQQISNTAGTTDTISGGPITTFPGAMGDESADIAAAGTLTISAVLGGTSAFSGYVQSATGTLILAGANTFVGDFDVEAGTVVAKSAAALGTTAAGTEIDQGATLDVQANIGAEAINVFDDDISAKPSLGSLICSAGTGTVGGPVTLHAEAANEVLTTGGAGTLKLSGAISGFDGAGVTKTGAGKTVLTGTSTYTGKTTVLAGTLEIDGTLTASPVLVGPGTLGGHGTMPMLAALTSNAKVAPGLGAATSPITLTSKGDTFLFGGTFAPEISGTVHGAADKLTVFGTVDLSTETLKLTRVGAGVPKGHSFTLINNQGSSPIMGTFQGLAEGAKFKVAGQTFRISYVGGNGQSVVVTALTALPPPKIVVTHFLKASDRIASFKGHLSVMDMNPGVMLTVRVSTTSLTMLHTTLTSPRLRELGLKLIGNNTRLLTVTGTPARVNLALSTVSLHFLKAHIKATVTVTATDGMPAKSIKFGVSS